MAQCWVTPSWFWRPHSSRAKPYHSGGLLKATYDTWSHPEETSCWVTDHLWVWMEITEDPASVFALPGRGRSSQEAGMPPLLAFKSARPSLCVLQALTQMPALPLQANASHSACMWEKHSTPTLRVTGSSPSWVNSAPYFCREDMQNLMELITCVWGRERLLGFKEQIRPSKQLPSLNTAYLLTRPDHHVNSDPKPLTSVTTWMRLRLAAPVSSRSQCSPGEKRVIPCFLLMHQQHLS